jgi:hypothetical protein
MGTRLGKTMRVSNRIYLAQETRERLDRIAARCAEQFGRRQGPGTGWNSYVIEEAIKRLDDDEFLAAELARREPKAAA